MDVTSIVVTHDVHESLDVAVYNVSLVTNYRSSFGSEIQSKGIDGLIKTLSDKNRQESNGGDKAPAVAKKK